MYQRWCDWGQIDSPQLWVRVCGLVCTLSEVGLELARQAGLDVPRRPRKDPPVFAIACIDLKTQLATGIGILAK